MVHELIVISAMISRSCAPVLLLEPLQCGRIGIDGLEPRRRASRLLFGAESLGHDALQAKLANVFECDISWRVDRLTDQKPTAVLT
jgi:hypothetical protein